MNNWRIIEARLKRSSSRELYFRHRYGWGWLSVTIGLAMLGLAQGSSTLDWPSLKAYLVGFLLLGIGLGQLCLRDELRLNVETRRFSRRDGLFWAPTSSIGSFDEIDGVVLAYYPPNVQWLWELIKYPKPWQVELELGAGQGRPVLIQKTSDESVAYAALEHYARLLRLPALDRTRDGEALLLGIEPEDVPEPAPDHGAPMSLAVTVGAPPAASGIELRGAPGRETILLPPGLPLRGRLQIERIGNYLRFSTVRRGRRHGATSRRKRANAHVLHRREIREIELRPLVGSRSHRRQVFVRTARGTLRVGRRLDRQSVEWLLAAVRAMAQRPAYAVAA